MGTQLQLDTLADRFGIEASYRDAAGKIRKTSEETKRWLSVTIEELFEGSKINGRNIRARARRAGDRSESAAGYFQLIPAAIRGITARSNATN